jgi:hypothetical protein
MQQPIFTDNSTILGDGTEEHPLHGSGGGGGTPGGADNDIQFKSGASSFGGSNDLQFFPDGSTDGELLIFAASDGSAATLFIGTDTTEQSSDQFFMQCDASLMFISANVGGVGGLGAFEIQNQDTGGIQINDSGGGGIFVTSTTDDVQINATEGEVLIQGGGGSSINVGDIGSGIIIIQSGNFMQINALGSSVNIQTTSTDTVAFFGAAGAAQAAAPTTLAEVITILTNLGFCAA